MAEGDGTLPLRTKAPPTKLLTAGALLRQTKTTTLPLLAAVEAGLRPVSIRQALVTLLPRTKEAGTLLLLPQEAVVGERTLAPLKPTNGMH